MKRPYRVVVAKPGLDGHDRGAKVIARALRDAGFEVIYTGLHQTPEQVVQAVVQEDADAVGLSLLSGAHLTLVPKVVDALADAGPRATCSSWSGGIIPDADIPVLKEQGVAAVFTPGAPLDSSAPGWARRSTRARRPSRPDDPTAHVPHRPAPPRAPAADPARHRATDDTDTDTSTDRRRQTPVDLFEYQGKQYFARYGIPISPGGVADTVDEAVAQAEAAGYPVVVKAQVKVGGRGKAGGIKLAADADEVRLHAGNILGLDIKGHVVHAALDRARLGHRQGVLRQLHARPAGQPAPRHGLGRGRRRDRAGGRDGPRRHRPAARRPGRRARRGGGPRRGRPAGLDHEAQRAGGRRCWCASTAAMSRATATWSRSTR